jgi:hypothetical protein
MPQNYKVHYKKGDLEIEIESTDKEYVDKKLDELTKTAPLNDSGAAAQIGAKRKPRGAIKSQSSKGANTSSVAESEVDIASLVNSIHEDDTFPKIEEQVFNKHSELRRILLVLYFAHLKLPSPYLTTGQIETATDQLNIKVKTSNISSTIKEKRKYFSTEGVRRQGAIMRYKLNLQGQKAFKDCLDGKKI